MLAPGDLVSASPWDPDGVAGGAAIGVAVTFTWPSPVSCELSMVAISGLM